MWEWMQLQCKAASREMETLLGSHTCSLLLHDKSTLVISIYKGIE